MAHAPVERAATLLARASLCLLSAMSLPACLVTSSPTFEEPERTPPFLLGPTAQPDLRQIKVIDTAGNPDPIEFSAEVRSEDNNQDIYGRLVRDYGLPSAEYPYKEVLKDVVVLDAATLDDKARTLAAKWYPDPINVTPGCHTVTLFATHELDFERGCPVDPADFDFLTWTVFLCDSVAGSCCDPEKPPGQGGCSNFQCPAVDESIRCDAPTGGAP